MVAAARNALHGDGPTKLLSQINVQRLLARLEYPEFLIYNEWISIVALWFVNPDVRKQTLELLRWASAGRIRVKDSSDPDEPDYEYGPEVAPWESEVGPDQPVYCVPGLPGHLRFLALKQLGEDLDQLRAGGLALDIQGYRGSMFHQRPLDAQDLDAGAFIRGAEPGKPISITGNPGRGKTHLLQEYIVAPALKANWVVVSNVRVRDPPENYIYVRTFAQALSAAANARLNGRKVMLIRDEGGSNRSKRDAMTKAARTQRQSSLQVFRKLDICEVFVIQRPEDVPSEVASTRSHWFHKPDKGGLDLVECSTPTLRGTVRGLLTIKALEAAGRPCIEYDTRDFSPFEIDADIVAIIDHEYSRRDASWESHVAAIKERLDRIGSTPIVRDPLTIIQLKRLVLKGHVDDTRTSSKFYYRFFEKDWLVNGISNAKALHNLLKVEWKCWPHPVTLGKACGHCLDHHPQLKLEAAAEAAMNEPPDFEDDEGDAPAGVSPM